MSLLVVGIMSLFWDKDLLALLTKKRQLFLVPKQLRGAVMTLTSLLSYCVDSEAHIADMCLQVCQFPKVLKTVLSVSGTNTELS